MRFRREPNVDRIVFIQIDHEPFAIGLGKAKAPAEGFQKFAFRGKIFRARSIFRLLQKYRHVLKTATDCLRLSPVFIEVDQEVVVPKGQKRREIDPKLWSSCVRCKVGFGRAGGERVPLASM